MRTLSSRPTARPHAALATAPRAAAPATVQANPVVRAVLYLFVFSIPFEFPDRTLLPMEVPTLMGFLLLGATLLNPSVCYRKIPVPVLLFAAYLWVFVLAAYVNGVDQRAEAMRLFFNLTQLVLLFWVIYNLLADPRVFRGVLLALVIACALRAGLQFAGIGVTARAVWSGGTRITILGQNANLSAMILSAGVVAVVGLRLVTAPGVRHFGLLTWPIAALVGAALIHTGSRGGLLCAGAGLAVFMLRGRTTGARIRNAVLAVAGIGALGWMAYSTDVMRTRFEEAARDGQLAGRERIYPALVDMFRERPLLGWAPVDNQVEIARRIRDHEDPRRDAHNLVGELLTATGLIGAIPFLAALALCVRSAWRARHAAFGILPFALLVTVLVGMIPGTWIAAKIAWLTFALAAGCHWLARPAREGT